MDESGARMGRMGALLRRDVYGGVRSNCCQRAASHRSSLRPPVASCARLAARNLAATSARVAASALFMLSLQLSETERERVMVT